jgi:anaerobic magnesium-protoporphyrin IX monomethyl ester cyclase
LARVALILPHLPQRMGAPYLGQQYIAAALLTDGHEVRVIDAAATHWSGDDADVVAEVEAWGPDLLGMTLFTYNARRGYLLAGRLRGAARLLVAGGAHPTALPDEPLAHGFDASVEGEGELAIVALARHLDGVGRIDGIPGVRFRGGRGPAREVIEDLDALALPLTALECWDTDLYSVGAAAPGGMMTSRGCPARCTFCANYVTGRAYRWRSAEGVVAEMLALRRAHGLTNFAFWDDAFTARRDRLEALCDAIVAEPELRGSTWTCITPANMVKPRDLARMARAGCVSVNFGIESGDPEVLRTIRKGQRVEQLIEAVGAASAEGMLTVVNFMFGFPGEDVEALSRTLDLMERLAPSADFFNNRGVLVPFPATPVYEAMLPDEPNPHVLDPTALQAHLEHDPTLDLDFFHYPDAVRRRIAECVRFKARHNQRALSLVSRCTPSLAAGT